jgi:hypothetical protein
VFPKWKHPRFSLNFSVKKKVHKKQYSDKAHKPKACLLASDEENQQIYQARYYLNIAF